MAKQVGKKMRSLNAREKRAISMGILCGFVNVYIESGHI